MIPRSDTCSLVLNECNVGRFHIYNNMVSLDGTIAIVQSKLAFLYPLGPFDSLSEISIRSLFSLSLPHSSVMLLDEPS